MGCGSCGTMGPDGKPAGCQSNGGCTSGGCNRLNVFNWLAEIPLTDFGKPFPIVEVSFNKGSRKDFFRNSQYISLNKGQLVTVEGVGGFDVGEVSLTGELVKLQLKKNTVTEEDVQKKLLRISTPADLDIFNANKSKEKEMMIRSRAIAKELNLEMKIAEAEYQADGKKVTFFYTADARVDFRELIKIYASEFKAKVEMRQIGARQESAKVGSIGSCGRELCCSTWLTEFKTVNTTAARYQNLSINQTKLSGQCGRLKCCLNYELDTYMDALKGFPTNADVLEFKQGRAFLQKKDIFRNLMWYGFASSSKQYPLTIERVLEVLEMNANHEVPEEVEAVEIQSNKKDVEKVVDMGFVNDVGQIKLSSLKPEPGSNKKRTKKTTSSSSNHHNKSNHGANQANSSNSRNGQERTERTRNYRDRNATPQENGEATTVAPRSRPQHSNNERSERGERTNNNRQNTPPSSEGATVTKEKSNVPSNRSQNTNGAKPERRFKHNNHKGNSSNRGPRPQQSANAGELPNQGPKKQPTQPNT